MSGQSHRSDPRILNQRTLEHDHSRLAEILQPGLSVLDVGCGTGAITAGIARAVAPAPVVGLDRDLDNLAVAREQYGGIPNLSFEHGDVATAEFEGAFDVVSAARTLQWISDPLAALTQMKCAARPGGTIVALDYNLAQNRWDPEPPVEFARFYRAFLEWRAANGWDNHMADLLPRLFREAGLHDVRAMITDRIARRGEPGFTDAAGIWTYVTGTLGPKISEAGFATERECAEAEQAYNGFVTDGLSQQTLVMRTVEGIV